MAVHMMAGEKTNIYNLNEQSLVAEFALRYGKGVYHCRGALRHLYNTGSLTGLADTEPFRANPELARKIEADFDCALPPVTRTREEDGTVKFALALHDGQEIESVIIPMKAHTSLCVSSQAGCARGCSFCRTARMGLARNLTPAEIVAQYMTARFAFGKDIRNIVFMGMGEPLDNLDAVLTAVDILTNMYGAALLPRRVSLSTCGQCQGLISLKERIRSNPEKNYHLMPIGISLHAITDRVRDSLMPVNRIWPLAELKRTLLELPQAQDASKIFFEYMVIPSVNDSREDAAALGAFMNGFRAKVNLIACVAPEDSPLPSATWDDVDRFWSYLRALGIACFSRISKGKTIQASCGQLATGD